MSRALGRNAPADVHATVDAIARRDQAHVIPAGIVYANRLGLTNAVPAKLDYLTTGTAHVVKIGNRTIRLRHVASKHMPAGSPGVFDTLDAASVGYALRWLGKDAVAADDGHDVIVNILRRRLPDDVKHDLTGGGKRHIPNWAQPIVRRATSD